MATDADRLNLLPGGMIGQAAKAKLSRKQQLDKAIEESEGGASSDSEEAPPKKTMTQAEFSWGKAETAETKAKKAKGLADLLRGR